MTALLWREGEPISVRCADDGRPLSFIWRQRVHRVARICNRWRASEEWWRAEDSAWREYLKLTTREGLLCLLSRDLDRDLWWLIRLYD